MTRQLNAQRRQSIGDRAGNGAHRPNRAALAGALHPKWVERGRARHAPAMDVRHVSGRRQQVIEKPGG